jgi:hypothetical protein
MWRDALPRLVLVDDHLVGHSRHQAAVLQLLAELPEPFSQRPQVHLRGDFPALVVLLAAVMLHPPAATR